MTEHGTSVPAAPPASGRGRASIHVSADFLLPLAHRDLLDVHLAVREVGTTSVSYEFRIEREGVAAVRARVAVVLLDRAGGRPEPWPDHMRELLLTGGKQPSELLVTM